MLAHLLTTATLAQRCEQFLLNWKGQRAVTLSSVVPSTSELNWKSFVAHFLVPVRKYWTSSRVFFAVL